ncbi:putative membrane protein [Rhizobium mongolense]|nr:putative membrane protein [Rhizobium mongolense]
MLAEFLLLAHVIGATLLFGTGAGIAFFMAMAHRTQAPELIAHVAGTVVIADTIFTATAVILQPVTG